MVHRRGLHVYALTLLLSCAVVAPASAGDDNPDPWEGMNRAIFAFNDVLDRLLLKPLAIGYHTYVPETGRRSVNNFFSNLDDVGVMANNVLQAKPKAAGSDLVRILMNSTMGLAGIVDVGTKFGFEKHDEDFGQTLGKWGVGTGPYLVLPIFGPSNIRDAVAKVPDSVVDPVMYLNDEELQIALRMVGIVDFRSALLEQEKFVIGDRYLFIRDAYLQRRAFLVRDGDSTGPYSVDPFAEDPFADDPFADDPFMSQ